MCGQKTAGNGSIFTPITEYARVRDMGLLFLAHNAKDGYVFHLVED